MDPRRVLTFRAVAHERSFSAAARALALTQPAVSQQVAALEKEVGARLLDREPGGWRSRRRGRSCSSTPTRSRSASPWRERQLGELTAPGRLRIGAFPSALAVLVPKAAARIGRGRRWRRARRPSSPSACGAASCTSRVGFQDAALPRREHDGVERVDLVSEPFLVALPPGSPARRRTTRCRSPRSPTSPGWRRAATT